MPEDSDDQAYGDWANKPFHFVLRWGSDNNIDIITDTGVVIGKAIIAHLLNPDQIERKGFLTDHVIGKKIKLAHAPYIVSPDEFTDVITLFVFGIFSMQLKAFGVELDGEPFSWRQESDKYLFG